MNGKQTCRRKSTTTPISHTPYTTMFPSHSPGPKSTRKPYPASSNSRARRHGPTSTRTETNTNATANIPWRGILWDGDHLLGRTNTTTPPQFYLSPIHDLRLGPSSPVTPTRPSETAEMPNVGLRPNLGGLQIKFLFDLHIHFLTAIAHLIIQTSAHYYTHYIIIPPPSLSFSYILHLHSFHLSLFQVSLCEGTHGNGLRPFPILKGGHLWLCYLW
jgi:hypothetical protein